MTLWRLLVEVPLNFLRDYTVPITDKDEWDRNRAAIVVLFTPFALFYFLGFTGGDEDQTS